MFHCRDCKREVARVGDIRGIVKPKRVSGSNEIGQYGEKDFPESVSLVDRAVSNPDVLSDECSLWPRRDEEAEADREDSLRALKVALAGLTARQRQVLEAVRVHKSQTKAAFVLGISQPVVKKTLDAIQNNLSKKGINGPNAGKSQG
jgi:DNA-directed RNA polymerase specialized sigma24 family protein